MTDSIPQACDLIIEAGWVVPVVPHGVVLTDHAVVVSAGAIVAVLPIASVAVQVTVFVPTGKNDPDAGTHANVTPGQLSDAVGAG